MNNLDKPVPDDDDDRLLFEKLEANAITHYPNPSRCGCPSSETLRRFVDTPRDVRVEELNDLHIFQCAQCTLELKRLREAREAQRRHERRRMKVRRARWWVALGIFLILGVAIPLIRFIVNRTDHRFPSQGIDFVLPEEMSLSKTAAAIVVHRGYAAFVIQLPSDAPGGVYEIVISKQPRMNDPLFKVLTSPNRAGQALRLAESLDLRYLPAGEYWIGVRSEAGKQEWFQPVSLK